MSFQVKGIHNCRPSWHLYSGAFSIYVYNTRWVGGQKSGKFVNVYSIKIVNEGRWVVKNM